MPTPHVNKKAIAQSLYFSGYKIKDISAQLGVSDRTINLWAQQEKWKERRAAQQISRDAIVQKLLVKIDALSQEEDAHADKIVKLANSIEKIERKGNVADYMHTFLAFVEWLKQQQKKDKSITKEFALQLIALQDAFVNERLQ